MINPRMLVEQMARQNCTPFLSNLIQLAQKGNTDQLRQIGRNMYKEQNRDFDKEFESFRQNPMSMFNRR